jgi:hypothetical protein
VFLSPIADDHEKFVNDMPTISQVILSGFLMDEFIINDGTLLVSTLCMISPKMEPMGFEQGFANTYTEISSEPH